MIGWGKSFVLALKAIIVGIVFAVVGIVVMVLGIGLAYIGFQDYYLLNKGPIMVTAWVGIPIAIFGFTFSSIGFYAALIKFTIDETVNEARGASLSILKSQAETSVRTCPNCRTPLIWMEQQGKWYCPKDKEYIP